MGFEDADDSSVHGCTIGLGVALDAVAETIWKANLETLGWGIDDSLFGMRLYPAAELLEVMESTTFARRFDFDPEVGVRLAWRGVPILNLPTPVRYPSPEEGGISQFRYLRDNILLTWMHLRLFSGFFLRLPVLIARGSNPLDHLNPPNRP